MGSSVLWKIECMHDEAGYSAERIPKPSTEGVAQFLLTAYSKMQDERDELKAELSSKKEPELKDLKSSAYPYWESLF